MKPTLFERPAPPERNPGKPLRAAIFKEGNIIEKSEAKKDFNDVKTWVKKAEKRPQSAPTKKSPQVARIIIDELPDVKSETSHSRPMSTRMALPNGTVISKKPRPTSAPIATELPPIKTISPKRMK